jgi:hypothetical protein
MRGNRLTVMAMALLTLSISIFSACSSDSSQNTAHNHQSQAQQPEASPSPTASQNPAAATASPNAQASGRRVPAYFKSVPDPSTLPPTLNPDDFTGETRDAYQVAKEIPVTLTQLPCFCYCDAIGHKSLHSCYETDHSAGCGICKVSALMASKLKKEGLSDEQIRDRLIAHFQ